MRQIVIGDRKVYSIAELADLLGVGKAAIYSNCANGVIPHLKLGKRIVLPRAAIDQWLLTLQNPVSAPMAVHPLRRVG